MGKPSVMDKHQLSERIICTKFITPAIVQTRWQQYQFREEVALTDDRVKYVIDGNNVRVEVERSQYLNADSKLITEDYRVLPKDDTKKILQAEFGTMTEFLSRRNTAERKQAVFEKLAEQSVQEQEQALYDQKELKHAGSHISPHELRKTR